MNRTRLAKWRSQCSRSLRVAKRHFCLVTCVSDLNHNRLVLFLLKFRLFVDVAMSILKVLHDLFSLVAILLQATQLLRRQHNVFGFLGPARGSVSRKDSFVAGD
jgi:hypothetical protein